MSSQYLTKYQPVPLFSAGLRQIIFNNFVCKDNLLPIQYKRHLITLDDGGTIALDWAKPEDNKKILWPDTVITGNERKNKRVCLVVPGLSGG